MFPYITRPVHYSQSIFLSQSVLVGGLNNLDTTIQSVMIDLELFLLFHIYHLILVDFFPE